MKNTILLGFAILALVTTAESCNQSPAPDINVKVFNTPAQYTEGRFVVQRCGQFEAGYSSNIREILIITDGQTKQQYLGITGVGITELHHEEKGNIRER